jgi:hypothetical protein
MPTETIYPVCVDCYLFAANGPDDFMSAERVQELATAQTGLIVSPVSDSVTGEPSEPSFSWHPCSVCGSHLGGYRFDCHVEMVTR